MTQAAPPAAASTGSQKYLTFKLGDESYGLRALEVLEIIKDINITTVPKMPQHIKGVINLRGKVVPIIDMRNKFEIGSDSIDSHTCVIVAQTKIDEDRSLTGLIVDSVEEVADINDSEIEEVSNIATQIDPSCIQGVTRLHSSKVTLLNIENVLNKENLELHHP